MARPNPVSTPVWVARVREALAAVDVSSLTDRHRLELVGELERLKGAASGLQARPVEAVRVHATTAAQDGTVPQEGADGGRAASREELTRSLGSQVALARRESPTAGDRFVGMSRALAQEFPAMRGLLEAGVVSERHVFEVVAQTSTLTVEDRAEADSRLAEVAARLSPRALGRAARRVAAELDAASVVARMERAVSSRRVNVRPAPDGMAYLTVLGLMPEVVGAHAALLAHSRAVTSGQVPDVDPRGRSAGQVGADTALERLSGRAPGQSQPVEVHLVMTHRALFGTGDPARSVHEPARVPGHGALPAPVARAWLRGAQPSSKEHPTDDAANDGAEPVAVRAGPPTSGSAERATGASAEPAAAWLRRLYTSPDGRDLVAMDSRRRTFSGLLRRLLVLRDDVCLTPWCDAPIVHADHANPARVAGATNVTNGSGLCARCNLTKEAPGWRHAVVGHSPRQLIVSTPTGQTFDALAPPVLGWGWRPTPESPRGIPWPWLTSAEPWSRSSSTSSTLHECERSPPVTACAPPRSRSLPATQLRRPISRSSRGPGPSTPSG